MGQSASQKMMTIYDDEDMRDIYTSEKSGEDSDLMIIDIRKKMPSVLNCKENGYSSVYALCFVLQYEYRKINISFIPSVYFMLYNVTKDKDGKCTLRDTLKSLSKFGVCNESLCPSTSVGEPSAEATAEAEKTKSIVYEKINTEDHKNIINILDNGSPVMFNYTFYKSFLNCKNNIISLPIEDDINLGVQTGVICGYEKDYFIVNNNWGNNWGDAGYVWIHKNFVLSGNDFWVLNKITKEHVSEYIKRDNLREKMIKDPNEDPYYSDCD